MLFNYLSGFVVDCLGEVDGQREYVFNQWVVVLLYCLVYFVWFQIQYY